MKHVFLTGVLLAAALPGAALADELRYSNFDVSWIDVELDGPANVDGDGLSFAGSYELNKKLFLFGEWQDLSFDFGIDGRSLEIGAGLHHELSRNLDFVGKLSYLDSEVDLGNFSADDDGLALAGGIRTWLGTQFQLDAMLKLADFDEAGSDTGVSVMGRYYFKNKLAVSFGTDLNDDADTLRVGFRAEF
ncbi:MAG TPA: hypothetical protein VFO94_13745 [Gammaproteobacteria bacterium]|nr:hypothetical protein [Gammaproteobacteria bacterium]